MNRVLVTGASGFIGKSLVPALLDLGIETVALVRRASRLPDSIVKSVEVVEGDIRDPVAMKSAVRGVDGIFHLAAAAGAFSLKYYRSVNVGGVKTLADAVLDLPNPPKLVHVSSLAAAGPSSEGGVTEQDVCRPVSYYGRTKLEAEDYLREISPQMPITILRPPCVFGPGDRNLLLFFQSIKRGLNVCAISVRPRYSFLEVHDLIDGMLAAMKRGKPIKTCDDPMNQGIYYLAHPQPVTFAKLAELSGPFFGRASVRNVVLPSALCWMAAGVWEAWGRITGRPTFLNLDKIREARAGSWVCRAERAARELEAASKATLETQLRQTYDWYIEHQWL